MSLRTLLCARELMLSSDECRCLRGKIVWSRVKTPQWGETVRQPIDQELIDALRPHEILESMLPQPPKRKPRGEHLSDE